MTTRKTVRPKASDGPKTGGGPKSGGLYALVIECVAPELDCGRYPVKRIVGDELEVGADIVKEGHDVLAGRVLYRGPGADDWSEAPLAYDHDEDRWFGSFELDRIGRWAFTAEGWTDRFGTWRAGLEKKVGAEQDVDLELREGAELLQRVALSAQGDSITRELRSVAASITDEKLPQKQRAISALRGDLRDLVAANYVPDDLTRYSRELGVYVDRERAGFAAWYEMFPRSQIDDKSRHGTFDTAAKQLPRLAELGFDVVYLAPIHPIGRKFRKGRNNALKAEPGDVGSPWAIGSEDGGHTAIEPKLGTIGDFDRFVRRAGELGLEVALDYALQCAPDHPWVKEHPDWFHTRPDGTIQYAENPPKKYQDIYPLNFWCDDRQGLWNACRDIFLYWIEHGVKTFRVDNPHTKPMAFWEWCIDEVQSAYPDVIFFSEAFTRPKRMKNLAKLGFTMSYTYFTWKNTTWDLRELITDLAGPASQYMRGNLFTNTPDILNEYLQNGGRPAFRIRLVLAATLSPLYGIYSGYELCENVPVRPGSEEYMNSEKYEIRVRDYNAPGNINADIRLLNRIRRENLPLQRHGNVSFHTSENDQVLFYRRTGGGTERPLSGGDARVRDDDLLIAVNLDPTRPHESSVHVPLLELGINPGEPYVVEDLLTGSRYTWRGSRNYIRLDPSVHPAHVLRVIPPAVPPPPSPPLPR